MFEDLYVPNKLHNRAVRNICRDILYVRRYYSKEDMVIRDFSNTSTIKIDIGILYLFLNDDCTADICMYGPGLQRSIPFKDTVFQIILQQNEIQ